MYSTYNEEKYFVAEKCIRTLKNIIYKHMTLISKNVYVDNLDDVVNEYNNMYYRTIKWIGYENSVNSWIYKIHSKKVGQYFPKP